MSEWGFGFALESVLQTPLDFCDVTYANGQTIRYRKEPKQGEWIRKTDGLPHLVTIEWFICSECGEQKSEATNFCPNCGASMKEGEAK